MVDTPDIGFDSIITIRWDRDEDRPVYDLGELDPYSAAGLLEQILADVRSRLPDPRETNDPLDDED